MIVLFLSAIPLVTVNYSIYIKYFMNVMMIQLFLCSMVMIMYLIPACSLLLMIFIEMKIFGLHMVNIATYLHHKQFSGDTKKWVIADQYPNMFSANKRIVIIVLFTCIHARLEDGYLNSSN